MALTSKLKRTTVIGVAVLTACSTIRTQDPQGASVDMTEAEFSAYLERVFRHHNKIVDSLMFVSGHTDSGDSGNLARAEAKMAHACLPLNELVTDAAAGNSPGFWARMQIADAVPACETATRKVEQLLDSRDSAGAPTQGLEQTP